VTVNSKHIFIFFLFIVFTYYLCVPLALIFSGSDAVSHYKAVVVTALTLVGLCFGFIFNFLDPLVLGSHKKVYISAEAFNFIVWSIFIVFVVYTFYSATSIPIVRALQETDANTLSQTRGEMFKLRKGWEILLLYMSAILLSVFMPLSIVFMYQKKRLFRHFALIVLLLFAISTLQKILFLVTVLPLLFYFLAQKRVSFRVLVFSVILSFVVLIILINISGHTGDDLGVDSTISEYISTDYSPGSAFSYFVWRVTAVPIFTAVDALIVHSLWFDNEYLLGSTSSLISYVFGMQRINFERELFAYQFGSYNEAANANFFFGVDAYINFGMIGVVILSFLSGVLFRWFCISKDPVFRSFAILFAFFIFNGSLLGTLLSNGFLWFIFYPIFLRIR